MCSTVSIVVLLWFFTGQLQINPNRIGLKNSEKPNCIQKSPVTFVRYL